MNCALIPSSLLLVELIPGTGKARQSALVVNTAVRLAFYLLTLVDDDPSWESQAYRIKYAGGFWGWTHPAAQAWTWSCLLALCGFPLPEFLVTSVAGWEW